MIRLTDIEKDFVMAFDLGSEKNVDYLGKMSIEEIIEKVENIEFLMYEEINTFMFSVFIENIFDNHINTEKVAKWIKEQFINKTSNS